jgi:hypothetical protein
MVNKAKPAMGQNAYEQMQDMLGEFKDKLQLDSNTWSLKAFDYDKNRIKGSEKFPELSKRLSDSKLNEDQVKKVKSQIQDALRLEQNTSAAIDKFNKKLQDWKDILAKNPKVSLDRARATVDFLAKKKAEMKIKIQEQYKKDKERIENLFKENSPFVTDLKQLGLDPAVVQQEMLTTLGKSTKEEIEKFEKSMDDSINKIEKNIENTLYRYGLEFNRWRKEQHFNRQGESTWSFLDSKQYITKKLRELAAKNPKNRLTSVGNEDTDDLFEDFKLEDLDKIHSTTGRKITFNKEDGKITGCNIELDRFFQINESGTREELESLAQTMKASGAESIVMNINYVADPKHAEELGRKAYEACIQAGYSPDTITIRVNGEEKWKTERNEKGKVTNRITKLFTNHNERLKQANHNAQEIAEKNKNMVMDPLGDKSRQAAMKKDIKEHREAAQQAAAQPPQTNNPGLP